MICEQVGLKKLLIFVTQITKIYNMKKNYIFTLLITFCLTGASFGQVILAEDFSYSDGTLLSDTDNWSQFSGTVGQILVNSGAIQLMDSQSEDVEYNFPGGAVTGDIYYAFDITVTKPADVSGTDFEYFAFLKPLSGFAYKARLDVAEFSETGFKLGISSGSSTAELLWDTELSYSGTYRVSVRYSTTVGEAELWVDAADESNTSITTTTLSTVDDIGAFAFRQASATPDFIHTIDNLVVGNTFNSTLSSVLSIDKLNSLSIGFYPNPVTNKRFTVTSNSMNTKEITIFNVLGKKVLSSSFSGVKSNVDVSRINSGIYILKVTEGGKTATEKLVIR
tara:strand:+ start:851 stop:1858 length:1008 start_codon:yes stop_codon:yes gene_type:complete